MMSRKHRQQISYTGFVHNLCKIIFNFHFRFYFLNCMDAFCGFCKRSEKGSKPPLQGLLLLLVLLLRPTDQNELDIPDLDGYQN